MSWSRVTKSSASDLTRLNRTESDRRKKGPMVEIRLTTATVSPKEFAFQIARVSLGNICLKS